MVDKESNRWRCIFKRFISCIKYLASQNLALRGHIVGILISNEQNSGNFLSLLILTVFAKYDPVPQSPFAQVNHNAVSYFSRKIKHGFISILAEMPEASYCVR